MIDKKSQELPEENVVRYLEYKNIISYKLSGYRYSFFKRYLLIIEVSLE